jgi:hypothetical protein
MKEIHSVICPQNDRDLQWGLVIRHTFLSTIDRHLIYLNFFFQTCNPIGRSRRPGRSLNQMSVEHLFLTKEFYIKDFRLSCVFHENSLKY